MIEKKILRNNLRHIIWYSLKCATFSGVLMLGFSLMSWVRSSNVPWVSAALNFSIGFLFGLLIPFLARLVLDVLLTSRRIRRMPYLGRIGVLVLTVAASMAVVHVLVGLWLFPSGVFEWEGIRISLTVTAAVFVIISTSHTLTEFLGRGFFRDMLLGRYHRARREEMIFLFVDLRGSTALAESLEPVQFFDLLNDFLSIVEQCCHYYGGSVYKYLGDGCIAVWPARQDCYARAVKALRDIQTELEEQNPGLVEKYGHRIELTEGLHCGKVLVGELGNFRKEIGYWGDAVNTAQRIQAACKEKGVSNLCSEAFYQRLVELKAGYVPVATFENVVLRGKEQPMTLISF